MFDTIPKERKTRTDGKKREYWDSLFTELQDIQGRLHNWSFPNATDIEKMNLLLTYHQTLAQKNYIKGFRIFTGINVILVILGLAINLGWLG